MESPSCAIMTKGVQSKLRLLQRYPSVPNFEQPKNRGFYLPFSNRMLLRVLSRYLFENHYPLKQAHQVMLMVDPSPWGQILGSGNLFQDCRNLLLPWEEPYILSRKQSSFNFRVYSSFGVSNLGWELLPSRGGVSQIWSPDLPWKQLLRKMLVNHGEAIVKLRFNFKMCSAITLLA